MKVRSVCLLAAALSAFSASCGDDPPPPARAPTPTPVATAPVPPPVTTVVTKRNVVVLGRTVGADTATRSSDGTMKFKVDVLENGRGEHIEATAKLGADGMFDAFDAHGTHVMGTPVEESFSRNGNHVRWQSKEEHGERDLAAPAFFVPVCELFDPVAVLAETLMKRGGTAALLPDGHATLEKATEATVRSAAGVEEHIVGIALLGVDVEPLRMWMNADGTYWGYTSAWQSMVPEGFESSVDALVELQNQVARSRDAKLRTTLAHEPPGAGMAFTHGRVLDVENGRWLADQTVIVKGGVISAVGPAASTKVPAGAETVDLGGKALLPGLFEMHAHTGDADGIMNIASGVTSSRDVGNDPDKLDDLKKRYDDGTAIGPHQYRMGFIEGRNDKAASSKITAENETEAKAAVEFFFKRNYDGIKIYNSMKPELVPVLAKAAHAHGMAVIGHIPVHMLANEAVRAGYDGIEHINMLFLNFLADHDTDTRTPLRFTLVGDKAADLDLKSKPVTDFIALLREHHTVIDPTLGAFEGLLLATPGQVPPLARATVARFPVQTGRYYLLGGVPMAGKEERYAASFKKLLAMVKLLHDEKITVLAGTDDRNGIWLHHELALLVEAGITPADVLKLATIESARVLKQDRKTGSIAVGKAADLFVVDGDPLKDIHDVSKISTVMRGGITYSSPALYEIVGIRP